MFFSKLCWQCRAHRKRFSTKSEAVAGGESNITTDELKLLGLRKRYRGFSHSCYI